MRSLGGYRLLSLLGKGEMARVYKVLDPVTGRLMAMKVLRPSEILEDLLGKEELERLFRSEARIMQELQSDHVVLIHSSGRDCGRTFVLQEYLCMNLALLIGEAIEAELPSRTMSPLLALDIVSQILQGLDGLHRAGVVHRDIKPANILLDKFKQVKIVDFGLARTESLDHNRPAGLVIGSPYYAAPEQEENPAKADHRADLYSAAVVLYRMVTGNLPEISRLKDLDWDLLGPDWSRFLHKALAPDPHQRFSHARDMLAGLEKLKQDWENRREQVCRLPQGIKADGPLETRFLRSTAIYTGRRPRAFKGLTRLLQPVTHIQNRLHRLKYGILDQATSLIWAGEISREQLSLEQAREVADSLNMDNSMNSPEHRWRLPTVDELYP